MAKLIQYGAEGKKGIYGGIKTVAAVVRVTMGPK